MAGGRECGGRAEPLRALLGLLTPLAREVFVFDQLRKAMLEIGAAPNRIVLRLALLLRETLRRR